VAEGAEPAGHRDFDDYRLLPLTGLPSDASRALGGFLALLLGAASLVLLIASVNVASMLSARALARRREMAVRAALGAGRSRLVRQLLTEILLLFAVGAAGGVALTVLATRALERIPLPTAAGKISFALDLAPDLRVLGFALGVSLLTGLLFGLAPALQGVRRDVSGRLRAESGGTSAPRSRLGSALVAGQLALSLLLLVAAGLFLRAIDRGGRVDPGFDATGVAVASFDSEAWGYDDVRARAFFRALRDAVAAAPGVTTVAYTEYMPLTMHGSGDELRMAGAADDARVPVQLSLVGEDYFETIRLPVAAGRAFARTDDARAPKVAVINETLARRQWPDGSALGRTFDYHGDRVTVVGIARDAKYATLTEQTPPMVYFPLAQQWRAAQVLMVRATAGAEALAPAIERAVRDLDPALPRPTVTALARENAIVLLPQRVAAMVTGALGAVGLLLASVGLYGVISYTAGRRTREIGIRVALGARRGDVLGLVVGDGMRLAGAGLAVGVLLAAGATRLLANLLYGVSPLDTVTFAAPTALLALVARVARWLPARRAAAADPKAVLAAE
jgi:predicted permease